MLTDELLLYFFISIQTFKKRKTNNYKECIPLVRGPGTLLTEAVLFKLSVALWLLAATYIS